MYRPGSCSACSVRTERARRRRSGSWPRSCDRTAERLACSATTLSATPRPCGRRIALTGQFASVDAELTAYENLALLARLYGYRRADAKARARELLETFDLAAAGRRQVATFSGGMRRRLDIAASLIVRPDLLFLDEPTTGLDPRSRQQTWELVRSVVAAGTTVVLTTQYLDEADQLADQIAVIDEGRLIAQGTSSELKASIGVGILQIRLDDPGGAPTPSACSSTSFMHRCSQGRSRPDS